jgi:methionyl-tRNA formyltransferase
VSDKTTTLSATGDIRTVCLFGKGELAVRIAGWFHSHAEWQLVWIVPVVPEPAWTSSLSGWARKHGVQIVESGDWADIPADDRFADLALSVFYDRILPGRFIDLFDRALNIHNGPLPRYRGVAPINWALKNEESSHGVTIHEITPGIDDGPIVAQLQYTIYPEFDEVQDVYGRAIEYGWSLFQQTMPILGRIEGQPQDESLATYYTQSESDLLGERRSFTRDQSGS